MRDPWRALFDSKLGKAGLSVLGRLSGAGYPSYFVGGCVRDSLLDRPVKDIDIATAAKPQAVLDLYPDAIPTGLAHGTVTVREGGCTFEVTTFRTESEYGDGRHPDEVQFIDSIEGDLERRDFTMNAMALSAEGKLVDPYSGQADLSKGILKCVGDPALRFGEDALRMLRCIRFAAEYRLQVEQATWQESKHGAAGLSRIAMERVRMELERMLSGADPYHALQLLCESELLRWTKSRLRFPRNLGLNEELHEGNGVDPLEMLPKLEDPVQRWALWLLRMGLEASDAIEVLDTLHTSKAFSSQVLKLMSINNALSTAPADYAEKAWKTTVLSHGMEAAVHWLPIANTLYQYPEYRWAKLYAEYGVLWLEQMPVYSIKELNIDGKALIQVAGKKGGPWVSHVLNRLLVETAMNKTRNDRQALLARATVMIAEEEGDQH